MGFLHAGNELDAFTRSDTTVVEGTTAGTYDSTYARGSIETGASNGYFDTPTFASQTTLWLHFEHYIIANSSNNLSTPVTCVNSSGTDVFRVTTTGSVNVYQAQYWNGSAWVNIGSTYSLALSTRYVFDIKIVCGGSGSFEFYVGGALYTSGSASMTSVDNIAQIRFRSCRTNTTSYYSQIIVANESTIGHKYMTKPPTGNGANTAWSSDYTAVDEATLNEADFITGSADGDIETFTRAALSLGSFAVKAVVVTALAKNNGAAPNNIQAALRIGGTNYFSSNLTLTSGFTPVAAIWATDPSTSATWGTTNAGAATTEFGVKAVT